MKYHVAYINLIFSNLSGINNILKSKAEFFSLSEYQIDFYIINNEFGGKEDNINYIKIDFKKLSIRYISYYFFQKYRLIEEYINLESYDLIILRYPFADKSGVYFTSKYNVITEHHTDEITEIKSGIKLSKLGNFFILLLRLYLEIRFSSKILRKCKGIIAVTDEIRIIEIKKVGLNIPSVVISNGININKFNMTGFRSFNGKELHMVFMANTFSPWHGLDRLLKSIKNYNGDVKIILHLIGNNTENIITKYKSIKNNIILYGQKYGDELDTILKDMNLAVSTLSLYKNKINEGCVIKTREYCARGIPFLLAYKDTDLVFDNNLQFYMPFSNDDSVIDIQKVIDFVMDFNSINNLSNKMRRYAEKHMGIGSKIKQYEVFIKQVIDNA